ncbi:MAG TPA: class I SAM-dependent methyltransferase [Actinomycetota bacterium]|nr:class I SAM-dependent methyltransferase [Actinomycetota bacterium]
MSTTAPDRTGRIPCGLCGTEMDRRPVGDTDMLLCGTCGMGRVPEMGTGPDFWLAEGETELDKDYWTTARSGMFAKALAHLQGSGPKGRLVDLGGGVGHFAELALGRGWDAYSVDISEAARKAAAERLGEDRSLSVDEVRRFTGQCDVVTLWCVIAHVLDPLELVHQAVSLLKPGGRLLVTTPNFIFQGSLARLLARLDKPYDLVCRDHILHFTPGAVERLLSQAGLSSWSFEYLGVTDNCFFSRRFARVLVPLKRVWNYTGSLVARIGLPPVCAELQVVAVKQPSGPGRSPELPAGS